MEYSASDFHYYARQAVWSGYFGTYRKREAVVCCAGIIGFALVDFVGCPAPLAVLVGGVCGVIGWAAHMH